MPLSRPFRTRVTLILLLLTGVVLWQGLRKIPTSAAHGSALFGSPATQASADLLHIATFNIAGGVSPSDSRLDLNRTARTLRGYDLVGLEEVHGLQLLDRRDQAAILGQDLHMAYLFAPSERRWFHDSFGNGVLTDLPVQGWQRAPLSSSTSESNRSLLRLAAHWAGSDITVIISHLDRHSDHDIELNAVIAAFANAPAPAILLGDLNTVAADPQLVELRKQADVVDCIGPRAGPTNVDWIFLRGLKCVNAGLRDDDSSDHRVAWADVQLSH